MFGAMEKQINVNTNDEPVALLLGRLLHKSASTIVTAESCTGGGIAAALTDVAGSSAWFEQGYVTYSNRSKSCMLGVPSGLIERCGAVSTDVVEAMLAGALTRSEAKIGVAVSGIAGPGGGSDAKPVGTVCIAWGRPQQIRSVMRRFDGDRQSVRQAAVIFALQQCVDLLAVQDD